MHLPVTLYLSWAAPMKMFLHFQTFIQKDDERYLEEIYQYSSLAPALQQYISSLTYITLYKVFF